MPPEQIHEIRVIGFQSALGFSETSRHGWWPAATATSVLRLSVAVFIGCTSPAPPAPPPRPAVDLAASTDATWNAVIDLFVDRNIPIKTMDRASGFMSGELVPLAEEDARAWADCGTQLGPDPPATTGTFNILIRGDSSRASIRVTAKWIRDDRSEATRDARVCTTRSVWERGIEGAVRAKVEGRTGR